MNNFHYYIVDILWRWWISWIYRFNSLSTRIILRAPGENHKSNNKPPKQGARRRALGNRNNKNNKPLKCIMPLGFCVPARVSDACNKYQRAMRRLQFVLIPRNALIMLRNKARRKICRTQTLWRGGGCRDLGAPDKQTDNGNE